MLRTIENALYAWLRQRRIERERSQCEHNWEDLEIEWEGDDDLQWQYMTLNTADVQYCTECSSRRIKPSYSTATTNRGFDDLTISKR